MKRNIEWMHNTSRKRWGKAKLQHKGYQVRLYWLGPLFVASTPK